MLRLRLLASGFALLSIPVLAQLNIPSDGSDGALNITSNTVIDLSKASYGIWSQDNTTNSGNGVYDAVQWAVVFKYSSVTIVSNSTVTFQNHPSHAPVVWLVQSNATINGTVSVNGSTGYIGTPGSLMPWEPAPGGFRGGAYGQSGIGAGFGPGGLAASSGYTSASSYGSGYGNPQILPLMGGSGGGAMLNGGTQVGTSGPSGAGAILIAARQTVIVNGAITAVGGQNSYGSPVGAGDGAIKIIANQVLGGGAVNARNGKTRVEATSISPQLVLTPNTVAVPPGTTPVIWPATNAPLVSVLSVNAVGAPTDPLAAVDTSSDVYIGTNGVVAIMLQTQNFPPTGVVAVRVTPKYATYFNAPATYQSGTFSNALWKATTTLPNGFCVLQAHATSP